MAINTALKLYKAPDGNISFSAILSIPRDERIPALAKIDYERIFMLIVGAVTMAFEAINFKNGLTGDGILELSDAIIDTSAEDNLAFEDLMLFLQGMVRGNYEVGEKIDIPKFMKVFEIFREERWQQLNRIRQDQHEHLKNTGNTGKSSKPDELSEHFAKMGDKLSSMKEQISSLKQENCSLKMDNL